MKRKPTVAADYNIQPEKLYPERAAADLIGFKPGTLRKRRCLGLPPEYVVVDTRTIRYPGRSLLAMIRSSGTPNP